MGRGGGVVCSGHDFLGFQGEMELEIIPTMYGFISGSRTGWIYGYHCICICIAALQRFLNIAKRYLLDREEIDSGNEPLGQEGGGFSL